MSTLAEWLTYFATLALGVGTIIIGWGLTALIVEHREIETGRRHDYLALGGCLLAVVLGGLILSTL
jgi:hypothetical protein